MSLIKTSLLIQREISLQIYFFGIVYFFRYVQISSTVENDCAYTSPRTVSLSLVAAVIFSFVSFSSYAGIINFLKTNLSMFSFSIQDFRYHKPVIFRMRWFSLWYSSNLPFSPRLDRYSRWQLSFFNIFLLFFFRTVFFFFRILTPQPFPVFGLTTLWLKNNVACSHRWHAKPTAIKIAVFCILSCQ